MTSKRQKIFIIDNNLIQHGEHVIFLPMGAEGKLPVVAHEAFPLSQVNVIQGSGYSIIRIPEWLVDMRYSGNLEIIQIR